nr:MAG TPA: hypothetical protein [Caudoviricetes sp.]
MYVILTPPRPALPYTHGTLAHIAPTRLSSG